MSLVKNLFYKIGKFKLDIPEWSFSNKGITALTGASGSGKTTIVKILCGLLPCKSLIWEFQGENLALLDPPERRLAVCFQDLRLFPHLSTRENILFPLQARGISFHKKLKDFEEIIHFLELEKSLELGVENLSGGEKQRTALARSLIVPPRFLFLDEPFSYLDENTKEKARKLTKGLIKKYSVPTLVISHERADVEDLADEEFFLDKGKISQK